MDYNYYAWLYFERVKRLWAMALILRKIVLVLRWGPLSLLLKGCDVCWKNKPRHGYNICVLTLHCLLRSKLPAPEEAPCQYVCFCERFGRRHAAGKLAFKFAMCVHSWGTRTWEYLSGDFDTKSHRPNLRVNFNFTDRKYVPFPMLRGCLVKNVPPVWDNVLFFDRKTKVENVDAFWLVLKLFIFWNFKVLSLLVFLHLRLRPGEPIPRYTLSLEAELLSHRIC